MWSPQAADQLNLMSQWEIGLGCLCYIYSRTKISLSWHRMAQLLTIRLIKGRNLHSESSFRAILQEASAMGRNTWVLNPSSTHQTGLDFNYSFIFICQMLPCFVAIWVLLPLIQDNFISSWQEIVTEWISNSYVLCISAFYIQIQILGSDFPLSLNNWVIWFFPLITLNRTVRLKSNSITFSLNMIQPFLF